MKSVNLQYNGEKWKVKCILKYLKYNWMIVEEKICSFYLHAILNDIIIKVPEDNFIYIAAKI